MGDTTKISWTDSTFNPWIGCQHVSPGCDHCYALTFAERFRGVPGHPYEQGFDMRLWPQRLALPLGWSKPRRIFVNSMSDLFHEKVLAERVSAATLSKMIRQKETFLLALSTHIATRTRECGR